MAEDEIVSSRNLIDTSLGPLRKFTGVLDSIPTDKKSWGEGAQARLYIQVSLNFRDIEVLSAVELYHFPTYTLVVNRSNRRMSRWGVLSESFNNIVDQAYTPEQLDPSKPQYISPASRADWKDAIGKRLGIVMADGEEDRPAPPNLWDGRNKTDKPTPCWMVYSVEGIGSKGKTAINVAVQLLNGKTLAAFNQAALSSQEIRADVALLQAISKPVSAPDSFANIMVTSGKFSKDAAGVYHSITSD